MCAGDGRKRVAGGEAVVGDKKEKRGSSLKVCMYATRGRGLFLHNVHDCV